MKTMTVLVAILAFMFLIACGLAAPSEQPDGKPDEKAQSPSVNQQDDGPVAPVTSTPVPTAEPPPVVDPTPTSKPDPSYDPNDPPSGERPAERDAKPAHVFTPEPPAAAQPKPEGGIAYCAGINPFNNTSAELQYLSWCHEALMQDVAENCKGVGDGSSAAERECGVQKLAEVQTYFLREVVTPCGGIGDDDARMQCVAETMTAANEHLRTMWATWATLLNAVDSHADVKTRKVAVAECVAGQGYERLDPNAPIEWQEYKNPDQGKSTSGQSEADIGAERARLETIDACARAVDLYDAQESIWLLEIQRMFDEDPARVHPLLDDGVKAALTFMKLNDSRRFHTPEGAAANWAKDGQNLLAVKPKRTS